MEQLTVLDLFSGCGGMSWGLAKRGFRVLAGIDVWAPALKTFSHNHPDARAINADVRELKPEEAARALKLDREELGCIVGGPPCQGFSKNVPAAYRFLDDPRNLLFQNYLDYARFFLPKAIVMENVAELYNAYGGSVRREIVRRLEELGYKVAVAVLFAPDYGAPQRRRRCFFVALRGGAEPVFPKPTFGAAAAANGLQLAAYRSAWEAISDLPTLENGEGCESADYELPPQNDYQAFMRKDAKALYNHVTRKLNAKQYARVSALAAGQGMKDLPAHLKPKSGYSGAYGRLDFEALAPTITRWVFHPGSGRYCHPREARLITIREAARLQTFSDDFRFLGTYIEMSHQIGNAVPPLLMEALAEMVAPGQSPAGA